MLALGKLLELTLAGREPAQKIQLTVGGVRMRWLGEGALEVRPPEGQDNGLDLLLSAGIHGNETAPMELLDELLHALARGEIEHLAALIEADDLGVQIGLVTDTLPMNGFQIFRQADRSTLTISPFRLGEQPNIRVGVAMATSAPEALKLHHKIVTDAWRTAMKGPTAAAYLRELLNADAPASASRSPRRPEPKAKAV